MSNRRVFLLRPIRKFHEIQVRRLSRFETLQHERNRGLEELKLEETNLIHIERLLAHSMKGVHCFFDNGVVASILRSPTEEIDFFTLENMDRIQKLFSDFMSKKSTFAKHDFLSSLEPQEYEMLVRTYFHILDNSVLASQEFKH